MVEDYTNLKLMPQTVAEKFDSFPDAFSLSASPLSSVSSISYTDENGDSQTLTSDKYIVQGFALPPVVSIAYGETWPNTRQEADAVTVTYVVGYTDADSVPSAVKNAIKLTVAYLYENREDKVKQMPTRVEAILWPYRVVF